MHNNDPLQRTLQKRGYRLTTQRRTILDILQHEPGSLTAETIYTKARQTNPQINLATVYRTLAALKETGLVEQSYASPDHHEACFNLTAVDDAVSRDDLPSPTTEVESPQKRFHFHCLGCDRIIPFQSSVVLEALRSAIDMEHIQVDQVCMCVQGYCADCAGRRP